MPSDNTSSAVLVDVEEVEYTDPSATEKDYLIKINDSLSDVLKNSVEQAETLKEIKQELTAVSEYAGALQGQLVETYTLLAFIFLLLIISGVYKLVSGLLNT